MEDFSRLRFSQYANDLALAIYELKHEQDMDRFSRTSIPRIMSRPQRQIMSDPLPIVRIAPASNITGLQSGAFQAKLAEMRTKIADRQKQALAKIDSAVSNGAAKMDAAAQDVAAKVDQEISAALHEFAEYSNGAPE